MKSPASQFLDKRVRISVACFGEEVAPCFAYARRFRMWEIGSGKSMEYLEIKVDESGSLVRIRTLLKHNINVLICNGIQEQERRLLESKGCLIIDGVLGTVSDALFGYLAGRIRPPVTTSEDDLIGVQQNTADLVTWTEDLFLDLGWSIEPIVEAEPILIDLIVCRTCRFCGKPVRVAVCCGAHTYRIENEIREFRRRTMVGYNARVYVYHAMPQVIRYCRDFEIDLLDPAGFIASQNGYVGSNSIPPLTGRIDNHEKLNIKPDA